MQANIYWSSFGFGDAVMQTAMIRQTRNPALPTVVFVRPDPVPGLEFYQCIKWIDHVVPWPPALEASLPYEALRYAMGRYDLPEPLALNQWDFRDCTVPYELPADYVAVQPSTHLHSLRTLPEVSFSRPVVLLGTATDAQVVHWPSATLDLRGKLSIAQSVEVVRRASEAYGCDSWCATLACMLGIPSTMRCNPDTFLNKAPGWKSVWRKSISFIQ